MPQLKWSIICERVIIDQPPRGVASLIDLFEEVRLPPPPKEIISSKKQVAIPLKFSVVTYWSRSDRSKAEKAQGRYRNIGPDGKLLGVSEFPIDLTTLLNMRIVMAAPGFPFKGEGEYVFVTELKVGKRWKPLNRQSFRVVYIETPKPAKSQKAH